MGQSGPSDRSTDNLAMGITNSKESVCERGGIRAWDRSFMFASYSALFLEALYGPCFVLREYPCQHLDVSMSSHATAVFSFVQPPASFRYHLNSQSWLTIQGPF